MRLASAVSICLWFGVFGALAGPGKDFWIGKARSLLVSRRLLSRAELRCAALLYERVSTPETAGITAVEKHGRGCGGPAGMASRMFTMNIDKATGRASWDRDTGDLVMKPIP